MYDCENRLSCVGIVLGVLAAAFFFVVGVIIGAFTAGIVIWNIVAILILAALLLLAIILILIFRRCTCKRCDR